MLALIDLKFFRRSYYSWRNNSKDFFSIRTSVCLNEHRTYKHIAPIFSLKIRKITLSYFVRGLGSKNHFKGSFRNIFSSTLYKSSCL